MCRLPEIITVIGLAIALAIAPSIAAGSYYSIVGGPNINWSAGSLDPPLDFGVAEFWASTIDIDLWRAGVGLWLCAETDEGRIVHLEITASDDANLARATQMDIAFTAWP